MNVLAILIPVSVSLSLVGLAGFVWALRNAQYEDSDGSTQRLLDERWDNNPKS